MSRHEIHDPWPSIYWKHSDSAPQFHLKAINEPNPSYGKEEKNSTLRAKLIWRNYSLYIESASLCPFKSEHIVHPPSSVEITKTTERGGESVVTVLKQF
jgi:hypothetical protein